MKTPRIIKKLIEKRYSQNNLYCGKLVKVEKVNEEIFVKVLKDFAIFYATTDLRATSPSRYTHILTNKTYRKYCASSFTYEYCVLNPTPLTQYLSDIFYYNGIKPHQLLSKSLLAEMEEAENNSIKNNEQTL